jgi:hypothetical protein
VVVDLVAVAVVVEADTNIL